MKIFSITFCILFVLFAAVQYNDPDPYIWIPIYLFAAMICLLAFFNKASHRFILISLVLFGIGFCYYIPALIYWIMEGMPSITETMKAQTPYVELVREALGLLICIVAILVIFIIKRRGIKALPSA